MTTISIRELHTDLPRISRIINAGGSILVQKYNKPFFKIVPVNEEKKKKYSRKEAIELLRFSGEPDLSTHIDDIVYGDTINV